MADNLKSKTVSGLSWNLVAQLGQQGTRLIIQIVLARLLLPKDFGLVAMVLVIILFARLLSEQGLSAVIIQRQDLSEEHLHSIYWFSVFVGLLFTIAIFFGAPLIATFYNEPRLTPMARVLAFDFIIASFALIPRATILKKLAFKQIAIIEISAILVSGVAAISLAFTGFGVWSLILQNIVLVVMTTSMVLIVSHWRLALVFNLQHVREIIGFSFNLVGFKIFNYWAQNLYNILIGRYMGSVNLGLYNRADHLMMLPISQVNNVLGRVMFPVLSSIQKESERTKQIYLNTVGAISLVSSPMMLGLLVLAEPFVITLLGEKWVQIIPILQILALTGLFQSIMNTTGWIYMSQGRTDWMLRVGLVAGSMLMLGIFIGVKMGSIIDVAIMQLLVTLIIFYPSIMIPGKLIQMGFGEVMKKIIGPLLGAIIMATLLYVLNQWIFNSLQNWLKLTLLIIFGTCTYLLFLIIFRIRTYHEVKNILIEQLSGKEKNS